MAPSARAPKGAAAVPAVMAFMNDVPHFSVTLFHRSPWAPRIGELLNPRAYGVLLSHVTYEENIALPHGVQSVEAEDSGCMKRYGRAVFLNVVALGADVLARRTIPGDLEEIGIPR